MILTQREKTERTELGLCKPTLSTWFAYVSDFANKSN